MATDYLNKNGLSYFWSKLKAYFAPKAHTHNAYEAKHSYTTAANQAKAWLRIANANTHQMDTSKPLHVQFLLTAWNSNQPADYYEQWFVDCQVFGRNSGIRIFGASGAPFSQVRVLYENTVADIDTNDRPAIDIYLNYVLATACHVEIQEVYNSGWTFLANGVLAASTVPTGFENRAVGSQGSGVHQATYASYGTYTTLQRSNITANITLADNDTYRMRVLNCTNAITVTVPSLNSAYAWFLIKNFNAVSTNRNVTVHPSTTSVLIDDSNADIVLKPGEWIVIASKAANSYTLIGDGRYRTQYGICKDNSTDSANILYLPLGGTKQVYYTTTNGSTTLTNVPAAVNTTLESYTIRHLSTSDWVVHQILHNSNGLYYRTGSNSNWGAWKTFAFTDSSITGNAATASAVAWSGVTGKPTTIAGYGITDAKIANGTITLGSNSITPITSHQTLPTLSRTISGSGNAITDITVSDHAITATKGATFLTSHQTLPTLSKTDSGSGNAVTAISVSNHAITVTKGSTFALDSNVIHKDSNEAIEGIKEFSNSYYDSTREGETNWESSSLIVRYKNYIKGSVPSDNKYANLLFLDKTGTNLNWGGRLGSVENDVKPDGSHRSILVCYKNEVVDGVDAYDNAIISVGYDSNGVKFAGAPSTSDSRTEATDILTRDWIPKDTRIVHTSGDETIQGAKHYSDGCAIHHPNIAKGTIPSSNSYRSIAFVDNTPLNSGQQYRAGLLESRIDSSGVSSIYMNAYQWVSGSSTNATLGVSIDRSGNISTAAPTPAASSNTTNIATTAWVRTFCDTTQKYMKSVSVTGSGNAVTAASLSNGTLTLTKGTTFLTSHQSLDGCAKLSSRNVFSQMQVISRANPYVILKETDIVKGNSSSGGWQGIKFFDNNYDTSTDGVNTAECGELIVSHGTTTEALYRFIIYRPARNSTEYASLAFGYTNGNADSNLYLYTNTHDNSVKLGSSAHRWSVVFAGTGSINTSDARLKSDISNIPDSVLDAWGKVRWCQFKMNDAIAEKGDKARIHSGAIAQEIASVFESEGLDPTRYALYCYDRWDAREEKQDTFGGIKETAWPAGDRYSLRYEEALCMEAAYQRRENARLRARLAALEDRLAALELRLGSE